MLWTHRPIAPAATDWLKNRLRFKMMGSCFTGIVQSPIYAFSLTCFRWRGDGGAVIKRNQHLACFEVQVTITIQTCAHTHTHKYTCMYPCAILYACNPQLCRLWIKCKYSWNQTVRLYCKLVWKHATKPIATPFLQSPASHAHPITYPDPSPSRWLSSVQRSRASGVLPGWPCAVVAENNGGVRSVTRGVRSTWLAKNKFVK